MGATGHWKIFLGVLFAVSLFHMFRIKLKRYLVRMIKKTSSEKCTHPNLSAVIYFIISWSNNEALVKYFLSVFFFLYAGSID